MVGRVKPTHFITVTGKMDENRERTIKEDVRVYLARYNVFLGVVLFFVLPFTFCEAKLP